MVLQSSYEDRFMNLVYDPFTIARKSQIKDYALQPQHLLGRVFIYLSDK